MKYFVIAGNYEEARRWTTLNKERIYQNLQVEIATMQYVQSVETLKGIHEPRGIFIGTWLKRPDIEHILTQLKISGANVQRASDMYYSEPAAKGVQ